MDTRKFAKFVWLGMALFTVAALATACLHEAPAAGHQAPAVAQEHSLHSPYAGQEVRGIKALSQEDVEGLLAGAGTPFGGMAKLAELNGYPGPRHVLDAAAQGEIELTDTQQAEIEALYEEMRADAVALGEQIVALEQELDDAFAGGTISAQILEEKVQESAALYGRLRIIHLKYHLSMVDILSPEQVAQYNEIRGYTSGDPCENVPEGHDPEMWRAHNNCGS
jgi:Spy/CpxP family protein refolding chaperone